MRTSYGGVQERFDRGTRVFPASPGPPSFAVPGSTLHDDTIFEKKLERECLLLLHRAMRARRARRDRANGGRAGAATRGEGGGYVAFRAGSMDPSAPLDARVHGGDPRGIHGGSTGAPRGLHGGACAREHEH